MRLDPGLVIWRITMHRLVSNLPAVLAFIGPLGYSECDEPKIQLKSAAVLMTFDALQERLNAPSLRLLDARPRADYEKAHIPGAIWVDAKAVEKLNSSLQQGKQLSAEISAPAGHPRCVLLSVLRGSI